MVDFNPNHKFISDSNKDRLTTRFSLRHRVGLHMGEPQNQFSLSDIQNIGMLGYFLSGGKVNVGHDMPEINRIIGSAEPAKTLLLPNSPQTLQEGIPSQARQKIFGRALEIVEPNYDLFSFLCESISESNHMLSKLEGDNYISSVVIFDGQTIKEVLYKLLVDNLMNAIESVAQAWKDNDYIGGEVRILAYTEVDRLWIKTLDNGSGFADNLLKTAGREQISSRKNRANGDFYFSHSSEDHLLKTGFLANLLGWRLIVENRKDVQGASVALSIPYV